MSLDLPFALAFPSVENLGRYVVSVLAVAGAAFLGGFIIGMVTQLLARSLTAKPVPRPALQLVRLLGALVSGTLAAMLLFGTGGGGGGGLGLGGGSTGLGTGKDDATVRNADDKERATTPTKQDEPPVKNGALRIEVLGDKPQPQRRFYRIAGESQLQTLEGAIDILSQRRKEMPDLKKVVVVLYQNSPDRDTLIVRDLVREIEARGLTPEISLDSKQAPKIP